MDILQPGEFPSTEDINRWRQQQEQSRPMLPAPTAGQSRLRGAAGETDIPWQPEYRWAKITGAVSGTGNPYTWAPMRFAANGSFVADDSADQGTSTYQPAFEANNRTDVPQNTIVKIWEAFLDNAGTTGRNFVFSYCNGDSPVLPSSTTINANGYYPGNVWDRLANTISTACWLIAIGPAAQPGHLIFLKPYVGTPLKAHTDGKMIYAIWANEDSCRHELDGDITTIQHYAGTPTRQYLTHDTGGNPTGVPALDWITAGTVDDSQNVIVQRVMSGPGTVERTMSANPSAGFFDQKAADAGTQVMTQVFGF